jgi:hypothetical protein
MTRWCFAFVLVSFVSPARGSSFELPKEFAELVPGDAAVLVEFRSMNAVAREFEAMRSLIAPDQPALTGAKLLADFAGAVELPGDLSKLDLDRPIGVAIRFDGQRPVPTFIVPTREAAAWLADVPETPSSSRLAKSSYAAFTAGPWKAPGAEIPRLVVGVPGALCVLRCDIARLVQTFRPMIDAGLGQFEAMIDAGAFENEDSPIATAEVFEMYLELLHSVVESADLLDVTVDVRERSAVATIDLANKPDSPLTKWTRPERVDYRELAGRLDRDAPMQWLMNYDQAAMTSWYLDAYGGMVARIREQTNLPNELVDAFQAYLRRIPEVMSKTGRVAALSIDLGRGGARVVGSYQSADPRGLANAWYEAAADPALARIGVSVGPSSPLKLGELDGIAWTAGFDVTKCLALLPSDRQPKEHEVPEIRRAVESLQGGAASRVAILVREDRAIMLVGGDDAWRNAAAKRANTAGELSAPMARLADALAGSNPGFGYSIDLGAGAAHLAELLATWEIADDEFPAILAQVRKAGERPLPITVHGGVFGNRCKFGVSADLDGVAHFARVISEPYVDLAKGSLAAADLSSIELAIKQFRINNGGRLPTSLDVLTTPDVNGNRYLEVDVNDPWGRVYLYRLSEDGASYSLRTLGADGEEGGSGADADRSSADSEP